MISDSARWHRNRRQAITKRYPDVAKLPRYNPWALMPIILTPLIYGVLAYYSQFFTLTIIVFLGWSVGSRCNFSVFKYSHELSHDLVSRQLSRRWSELLLYYLNVFNLSTSVYLLFSFGHKPHHASLGETTLLKAKRFLSEKHPDIELLIDRYYFELPSKASELPVHMSPGLFNNRLLRLLSIGLIYPVTSFFKGTFLFHMIFFAKYLNGFRLKKSKLYHQRLNQAMLQIALLYMALIGLFMMSGWKALLFMVIADMSQRGLLWHPIVTFTIGSHKTWENRGKIQPTTSAYGRSISFLLMKMNYHVEHHDFPDLPCKYLCQLKKMAPDYYMNINRFKGYSHVMKTYGKSKHWYYGGDAFKS